MQSPGNIHTLPHRRDWNFLRLGGSVRLKNLKKCMKLNWNFQRGGSGVLEKIPSVEEVCIFSEIFAHLNFVCRIKLSLCHLVFKRCLLRGLDIIEMQNQEHYLGGNVWSLV